MNSKTVPTAAKNKLSATESLRADTEIRLIDEIARLEKNGDFRQATLRWRNLLSFNSRYRSLHERNLLFQCILNFLRMDTDKDGTPDWTAIVDRKVSALLYPYDADIDGDGIENVLDADPMLKSASLETQAVKTGKIPPHLRARSQAVRYWQEKLWHEYQILAIEHTVSHSPAVLRELYFLLKYTLPPGFKRRLANVQYLYAFASHDANYNIAAYHKQLHAISIGGRGTYPDSLTGDDRNRLLHALAHELGHAFLLQNFSAADFKALVRRNGWNKVIRKETEVQSLYDAAFFLPHPEEPESTLDSDKRFVSAYSFKNAHEWFAELFATALLSILEIPGPTLPEKRSTRFFTRQHQADLFFR